MAAERSGMAAIASTGRGLARAERSRGGLDAGPAWTGREGAWRVGMDDTAHYPNLFCVGALRAQLDVFKVIFERVPG